MVFVAVAAACAGPAPTPMATLSPPPVTGPTAAPTPTAIASPVSSSTPLVPTRPELIVCLTHEPVSLYRYALPEPDGNLSREHILAALEDGPMDRVNFGVQPVLFEKLPAAADGDLRVDLMTVRAGDRVVDDLGRVVTLTAGVTLDLLDGAAAAFSGEGELQAPQVTARFVLQPDLRWSDGAPLTAADFIFGFEVASSPDSFNADRDRVARTAAYRALDERTVEWVGVPGRIDADDWTNLWPPLPRHLYGGRTPAEIAAREDARRVPLSYGPFAVAAWSPGDRLVVERNPHYFRAAEGLPRLARVVYRFVPDPAQLAADLAAGDCDVAPRNPAWDEVGDLPGAEYARWAEGAAQETLVFGLAPAAGAGFFGDVRARRAVAHCLDRAALAPRPSLSERRAAPHARPHFPAGLDDLAFDPAQGRALLAELAWSDSDGDGALDQAGVELRLILAAGPPGDPLREALAAGLAAQLDANCGIRVDVQTLTAGERSADWPDGALFGRRFDLALVGWNTAQSGACAALTTRQIASDLNPAGANLAGYSRPAFDDACRRARTALDPALAAQARAEAEGLLASDLPLLPLVFRLRVIGLRPEVAGLAPDPTAASELWSLETATVRP